MVTGLFVPPNVSSFTPPSLAILLFLSQLLLMLLYLSPSPKVPFFPQNATTEVCTRPILTPSPLTPPSSCTAILSFFPIGVAMTAVELPCNRFTLRFYAQVFTHSEVRSSPAPLFHRDRITGTLAAEKPKPISPCCATLALFSPPPICLYHSPPVI